MDTNKIKAVKRKLRNKYGYSTNTDYGRGMGLIKPTDDENGDFCFYVKHSFDGIIVWVNGEDYVFTYDEFCAIADAIKEFREVR